MMNITIYTMEELVLLDGMLSCTLKICRYQINSSAGSQ